MAIKSNTSFEHVSFNVSCTQLLPEFEKCADGKKNENVNRRILKIIKRPLGQYSIFMQAYVFFFIIFIYKYKNTCTSTDVVNNDITLGFGGRNEVVQCKSLIAIHILVTVALPPQF